MKQVNIRQLGRMSARDLKAGAFEVVERRKPIGRFIPYDSRPKRMPKHDFIAELTRVYGPLKRSKKFGTPALPELDRGL